MPKYRVQLSDGRTFEVEASGPPSEADVMAALGQRDDRPAAPAPPEQSGSEKSVGGFASNVISSAGKFVGDLVSGVTQAAPIVAKMAIAQAQPHGAVANEMRGDMMRLWENRGAIGDAVKQGLADRYGSLDAIGNTLYEDPVGVLSDVATVASAGAGALTKVSKAPVVLRIANAATKVANAVDPAAAVLRVAKPAANVASDAVIAATVRPSAAIRKDFGGHRGVAQAIKQERVFSEASAGRKLDASVAEADRLIGEAEATGKAGVPAERLVRAVEGEPATVASRRRQLGVPDESTSALRERLIDEHTLQGPMPPGSQTSPGTREIPLTEAQALKREAQDLAYELGTDNETIRSLQQRSIARALREGIEDSVPAVAPVNEQSQRLLGAKRAFAAAEDRPDALGLKLAVPTLGTSVLLDSPRAGAAVGIGINEMGKFIARPEVAQAVRLMRAQGLSDQIIEQVLARMAAEEDR